MEWMILPLRRYFDFSGRSQRKEYWMFILFVFIVSIVLSIVDSTLGLGGSSSTFSDRASGSFAAGARTSGGLLSGLFSLAMLIPSISVSARRLHDLDRSGWWLLAPYGLIAVGAMLSIVAAAGAALAAGLIIGLVMLVGGIGFIVLLVWFCMEGTRGPNRFGPDPKGGMADVADTFR